VEETRASFALPVTYFNCSNFLRYTQQGTFYFSLHLPGYADVADRHDAFDGKPEAAGRRRVHGDTCGHDDIFAARSAEIFVELVKP